MRTSELKGGGDVTIPSQHMFSLTIVFLFTSTLADALHSMDVSRYPDSLTSYPRSPCHVPPARVLVCFLSILRVSSYLYYYGLSTHRRLLTCLLFPLLCCQLVYLCFLTYASPFVARRLVSRLVISGF